MIGGSREKDGRQPRAARVEGLGKGEGGRKKPRSTGLVSLSHCCELTSCSRSRVVLAKLQRLQLFRGRCDEWPPDCASRCLVVPAELTTTTSRHVAVGRVSVAMTMTCVRCPVLRCSSCELQCQTLEMVVISFVMNSDRNRCSACELCDCETPILGISGNEINTAALLSDLC